MDVVEVMSRTGMPELSHIDEQKVSTTALRNLVLTWTLSIRTFLLPMIPFPERDHNFPPTSVHRESSKYRVVPSACFTSACNLTCACVRSAACK